MAGTQEGGLYGPPSSTHNPEIRKAISSPQSMPGYDTTGALELAARSREIWARYADPGLQQESPASPGSPTQDEKPEFPAGDTSAQAEIVIPRQRQIPAGEVAVSTEVQRGHLRFAGRFAKRYGSQYLYAHGLGWHEWDGTRWAMCKDGGPVRALKDMLDGTWPEVPHSPHPKELVADIRGCSSAAGVKGVLELAGCLEPCAISGERLDLQPLLFNTVSGTLNLETGQLQKADQDDLLTKLSGAPFSVHARSQLWDDFLERVLPEADVREFVQRLMGYAMLGEVREHVMPIFTGEGANGKGTLRDAVTAAFGDFAVEVDPELLMETKNPRHLTFLMELRGRRLVFCSETEKGRRFAESTMKRLVGGDPIQANRMHRDPITFDPTHTLVMMTNHLPVVSGDDPAVWRRILVVPFDFVIPEGERDPTLPRRLQEPAVRAAVLAWAYQGYLEYRKRGLDAPEAVRVRTEQYRQDSDMVSRFIAEELHILPSTSVPSRLLYSRYELWCRENGEIAATKTALGRELTKRRFRSEKRGGDKVYVGLALVSHDWEDER